MGTLSWGPEDDFLPDMASHVSNVDGVREHTTVSGNMSQRTGTSVSGNRNVGVREQYVGVREQYVGVREHMRTVHIVRCAACANSAQSA